jgi:hypothetical protein
MPDFNRNTLPLSITVATNSGLCNKTPMLCTVSAVKREHVEMRLIWLVTSLPLAPNLDLHSNVPRGVASGQDCLCAVGIVTSPVSSLSRSDSAAFPSVFQFLRCVFLAGYGMLFPLHASSRGLSLIHLTS